MQYNVYCVGCGQFIATLQTGDSFGYVCPCGATIFHTDTNELIPPLNFVRLMAGVLEYIPHIDRYVGSSMHRSPLKEQIIHNLRERGCTWSHECEECWPRILAEKAHELEMKEKIGRSRYGA